MVWYQLFIEEPHLGFNMKEVDDTLTSILPACFRAPDGIPIKSGDGTYEVRVYGALGTLSIVKAFLTEYHRLKITHEVKNEGR